MRENRIRKIGKKEMREREVAREQRNKREGVGERPCLLCHKQILGAAFRSQLCQLKGSPESQNLI